MYYFFVWRDWLILVDHNQALILAIYNVHDDYLVYFVVRFNKDQRVFPHLISRNARAERLPFYNFRAQSDLVLPTHWVNIWTSLPETSAHVINHMLLQFVIEHVLFFSEQLVRFPVGELSHLFKQAFMQRLSWLWWYGSY